MVGEMDDQAVADIRADQRSGNAAVVRPRLDGSTRGDFDDAQSRVEVDLDDMWIGIDISGFLEPQARVPVRGLARLREQGRGDSDGADERQKSGNSHGLEGFYATSVPDEFH